MFHAILSAQFFFTQNFSSMRCGWSKARHNATKHSSLLNFCLTLSEWNPYYLTLQTIVEPMLWFKLLSGRISEIVPCSRLPTDFRLSLTVTKCWWEVNHLIPGFHGQNNTEREKAIFAVADEQQLNAAIQLIGLWNESVGPGSWKSQGIWWPMDSAAEWKLNLCTDGPGDGSKTGM